MIEDIEKRLVKDVAFLFERLGFEVYLDSINEPVLLLSLPRCNKCGNPWYFNISQCFLCGAIQPFVMKDKNGKYISPTNASAARYYPCINPDCLSNNDSSVSAMIQTKNKGIFDRKSPISLE